jgi:hypothetical protein
MKIAGCFLFSLLAGFLVPLSCARGQTNAVPVNATSAPMAAPPAEQTDTVPAAQALVTTLHQAWQREHDPAKRTDLAGQVIEAILHDYDEQPVDVADDVARDGLPEKTIAVPTAKNVTLHSLQVLTGTHRDEWNHPGSPVFRRIARDRIEAWTTPEGWLFDGDGRLLVDAHVPRRDGVGRDWSGAFLPDGRWITTDLWANDRQLTCFDAQSDPRWNLAGSRLVTAIKSANPSDTFPDYLAPSVGWARADRTGNAWLVCVGTDWSRGLALVSPSRHVWALSATTDPWQHVYPRSMGVRGFYISLFMMSDDGALTVSREEAGHGIGVGWPVFALSSEMPLSLNSDAHDRWRIVINGGTVAFGFWPHSHAVYIGTDRRDPTSRQVWFFDAKGRYEGQIDGSYLADAALASNLLVQSTGGRVTEVHRDLTGNVTAIATRNFHWPDGGTALPLAIYDDLKLGFFLRGADIVGDTDDGRRARAAADVVLARW